MTQKRGISVHPLLFEPAGTVNTGPPHAVHRQINAPGTELLEDILFLLRAGPTVVYAQGPDPGS